MNTCILKNILIPNNANRRKCGWVDIIYFFILVQDAASLAAKTHAIVSFFLRSNAVAVISRRIPLVL